jgi:hypothetical protein
MVSSRLYFAPQVTLLYMNTAIFASLRSPQTRLYRYFGLDYTPLLMLVYSSDCFNVNGHTMENISQRANDRRCKSRIQNDAVLPSR